MVAAAAHATAVDNFAAVGYAVAAGAGGVVASAHTARVKNFSAFRDSIAACARLAVAPANAARVQLLAAVGHTIASRAGGVVTPAFTTRIRCVSNNDVERIHRRWRVQKCFGSISAISVEISLRCAGTRACNDEGLILK